MMIVVCYIQDVVCSIQTVLCSIQCVCYSEMMVVVFCVGEC